jgi:hypothetical protein
MDQRDEVVAKALGRGNRHAPIVALGRRVTEYSPGSWDWQSATELVELVDGN